MLSFEEAVSVISSRVQPIPELEIVELSSALRRVFAKPVVATRPNPSYDNSAVDGYLLGNPSATMGDRFELVGEISAGSLPPLAMPLAGQAVRIFTGAPVPPGNFCVVMQEDVEAAGQDIKTLEDVRAGQSIRKAGTDFQSGAELVSVGTRISAAEIALCRWNGLQDIEVFAIPKVAVLVTGDEIVQPGEVACEGQIYDSNGPMLEALVQAEIPAETLRGHLPDDFELTCRTLDLLGQENDLILISGGASVGDYDHIPAAVSKLGAVFFHKVSIKPGKPVLFGKIGKAFVFGLPGNPASAYVCFQIFVRSALRRIAGEADWEQRWLPGQYGGSHEAANRDEFIRVTLESREGELWGTPVHEQGSFGLRSLSAGHALARLHANRSYKPGDPVSLMIIPK